MRNKLLIFCILTLFMGSITVLFIAEAEAARSRSSGGSSRSSKGSSSRSYSKSSNSSKSSYNRSVGSRGANRSTTKSTFSPSGYKRPATLGGIAAVGASAIPSTYSKPGKFSLFSKKKKKKGYDDDDDFDDAFIGTALGFGAGSILGFLLYDEDEEDAEEGSESGGFMLFFLWIFLIIAIKLARSYFKKKRTANGRLERKLKKANDRKGEAAC